MPLFYKKKDKGSNTGNSSKVSLTRTASSVSKGGTKSFSNLDSFDEQGGSESGAYKPCVLLPLDDYEDQGDLGIKKSSLHTSSQLSKNLTEIVHDRDALPLFISFMESRKADKYIRFWLDAESFQVATLTRNRTQSRRSTSSHSLTDQPTSPLSKTSLESVVENTPVNSVGNSSEEHEHAKVHTSNIENSHQDFESDNLRKKSKNETLHLNETLNHVNQGKTDISNEFHTKCVSDTDAKPSDIYQDDNAKPSKFETFNHSTVANSEVNSDEPVVNCPDELKNNTESACNPIASLSAQNCDSSGMMDRHCSEPVFNENTQDLAGSHPKHRHLSESNLDNNVNKGKSGLNKVEDIKDKLKRSIARDAVNIFTKYISLEATHPIGITDDLRNETISSICREDGEVDPYCFIKCQQFVLDVIQKDHFPAFQGSEYHCKHQVDVLTGGKVDLPDILYNEMALFYFTEFLEQEGGSDLLQFWMAVDNFQLHLNLQQGEYDGIQAQNDAMVFYDKYFSLQASQPLGFDDKTRFEVESNICREGGPLPDVFSKPRAIVLNTLDKVYFTPFLKSEVYYKYLSDLISTVNMSQDLPTRRKRTGSDASSEHSAGSQSLGADSLSLKNTLLAIDSSSIKKAFNKLDVDMRIDDQLLNPEELWKRPAQNKMSLGKVNDFGQFLSEFTPEPDQKEKKKSFFKKSRFKEKEQEDMALQIAQMILSDVATMTKTGDLYSGKDTGNAMADEKPPKL